MQVKNFEFHLRLQDKTFTPILQKELVPGFTGLVKLVRKNVFDPQKNVYQNKVYTGEEKHNG